jgi:hypothetical protein
VIGAEGFLAVAFLTGWLLWIALPLSMVVLVIFAAAVLVTLHRKRLIRCGCFGNQSEYVSRITLIRLLVLLASVLGLVLLGPSSLSVTAFALNAPSSLSYLVEDWGLASFMLLAGAWLLSPAEVNFVVGNLWPGQREQSIVAGTEIVEAEETWA